MVTWVLCVWAACFSTRINQNTAPRARTHSLTTELGKLIFSTNNDRPSSQLPVVLDCNRPSADSRKSCEDDKPKTIVAVKLSIVNRQTTNDDITRRVRCVERSTALTKLEVHVTVGLDASGDVTCICRTTRQWRQRTTETRYDAEVRSPSGKSSHTKLLISDRCHERILANGRRQRTSRSQRFRRRLSVSEDTRFGHQDSAGATGRPQIGWKKNVPASPLSFRTRNGLRMTTSRLDSIVTACALTPVTQQSDASDALLTLPSFCLRAGVNPRSGCPRSHV